MLNISIPPQVKTISNDSTKPAIPDISTNNPSEKEQFNNILAREMSDKTPANNVDPTTVSVKELSPESGASEVIPQMPENSTVLIPGDPSIKFFTYKIDSTTSLPDIEQNLLEATIQIPDAERILTSEATRSEHTTNVQGQISSTSLLTPVQTRTTQPTQPNPSRYIPVQNSYLGNMPWQSYSAANSATSDQTLPPFAEVNNAIPSNVETSAKLALSESIQHTGLNSAATMASSTMSTIFAPHDINLDTQIGQPKWGGDFAQKIVWLTSQQQQIAEIRLNPAHLGPVEVKLSVTGEQATAQFISPHAAVREAIEAALPKLREMMAENGIALGNVTVGTDSFQQQANTGKHENKSSGHSGNIADINDESISQIKSPILSNRHNGIVNTFA